MVVNAPQSNVLSAAEHTIALLLAQARNVPQADRDLRSGSWNRSRWEGVELYGKTLGVVGLGRVGVLVAQRAHAFGMRLAAYDPYVSDERFRALRVRRLATLDEAVDAADILTVHTPLTDETLGMIGKRELARMKSGAIVMNLARGGIIEDRKSVV